MWKHLDTVVVALCLSLVASPALGQLFSTNLRDDFPVPNQWPGPTNPPEEGDLWIIGNLSYPDSFQDFSINQLPASITGEEQIIGWGAGWLGGQTDQNQVGPYQPLNDDIWTDLGEIYIVPTSGRQLTVPPTFSMEAQLFTPPTAGTYRVQGRFYGLATGNAPLSTFGLFNEGPVKIIKGEADHSNGQLNYLHEVLHDDWIHGSVDSIARGGPYAELGTNPESFFDMIVVLDDGMPLIFAEGTVDVHTDQCIPAIGDPVCEDWSIMRFGIDVQIDLLGGDPWIWREDASGDWHDPAKWLTGGVPNDYEHRAHFTDKISSSRTVFTDTPVSVSIIEFDNTNQYVIAGGGGVNIGSGSMGSSVMVKKGTHQFQTQVDYRSDSTVDIATGSTLIHNNALNLNGNTLTKTGGGELSIRNDFSTGGGTLINSAGTISGSGTIGGDVNNNATISPGNNATISPGNAVPEPAACVLLVVGLIGFLCYRRR